MTRVAIVGAGLSGLVVARGLQGHHDVTVFEKSRGVGGRMATRYEADFEFDHGAQFFTAKDPEFVQFLRPLLERGIVRQWNARIAEFDRSELVSVRDRDDAYPYYVGAPRMNQVCKALAEGIELRLETKIAGVERETSRWRLSADDGVDQGRFDWVVLAIPAAQAVPLAPADADLRHLGHGAIMRPCFALMLGFERPLDMHFDAAVVRGSDIGWIAVNSSKPGRPTRFTLVVHSTNAYADTHVADEPGAVGAHLVQEASEILQADCSRAFCRVHRWRYANADSRDGPGFFIDRSMQLAACGDWFRRGRVEAAFQSGFALTAQLTNCL